MAAHESLGEQFNIVHPHRSVRIGERMYPAVETGPPEHIDAGYKYAVIPMESGHLMETHWMDTSHLPEHPDEILVHQHPMNETEHQAMELGFEPVGGVHGARSPEEFHHIMDTFARQPVSPERLQANRETMASMRKFNER